MKEYPNDDWLSTVRQKMEDYRVSPPKEGWKAIEEQLPAGSNKFRRAYRLWIAAAAMVAAIAIPLSIILKDSSKDLPSASLTSRPLQSARLAKMSPKFVHSLMHKHGKTLGKNVKMIQVPARNKIDAVPSQAIDSNTVLVSENKDNSFAKVDTSQTIPIPPTTVAPKHTERNDRTTESWYATNNVTTSVANEGWELALAFGSSTSGQDNGPVSYGTGYNDTGSNYLGNTKVAYNHRMPVRIGLLVSRQISSHFSIQTGVTGTYLLSVPKDKVLEGTYNQRIYYIGVPLKLSYHFYKHKRLHLYWSNGVEAEKCIYAKCGNDNLSINRLQWSVNSALGVQYQLVKRLSLFAEPGISYYWSNGSDIETYRTVNPLNFDFHVGLKLEY